MHAIQGDIQLIIEDGSHVPQHQATCLIEGVKRLSPGGLYILEDIQTSHPLQPDFSHLFIHDGCRLPNALNVLLAVQHWRDVGLNVTATVRATLAHPDFFSPADIDYLDANIASIEVYKRTHLPLRCYACQCNDTFDYINLKCQCGTSLYEAADSMTALIWKKSNISRSARAEWR